MAQSMLEITDKDGWRKEFPLQKIVTYIGSDPASDIVLETWHGTGVASRHIQIISLAAEGLGYRLVNLGDADILLGPASEKHVSPRSFAPMSDGDRIRLGDFALVFHAAEVVPAAPVGAAATPGARPGAAPAEIPPPTPSNVIGLKLSLPGTQLSPDRSLDGSVTVTNLGSRPGVQFKLAVEGLGSDCYEIGPGPVLFPGAEKSVTFRLCHPRKPQPLAGEHRFSIRATAPDAYPGESAVVFQNVVILPFYSHRLRLVS